MKKNIAAIGGIIGALSLTMQAGAGIVYSEDFNDAAFKGTVLNLSADPVGNVTERWGNNSAYYTINNAHGWNFGPADTYLAVQAVGANQGVLLNEPAGIATKLENLTANAYYTLSFNYSGDNRPGSVYGLAVDVNGANKVSLSGSWNTTSFAGHLWSVVVQADGSGALDMKFYQTSPGGSQASPIIDDVTLSTVPEPTTMIAGALLLLPFGASTLRILRRRAA